MTNTGSPPADLDSACAQIGSSSAPSQASPRDLSKVAVETNPPFHGNEGDQTELDDLVRLLGPEVLAPLVIAKVLEKRKKVEELEKDKAQNEADLSAGERWLDKRFPRESWDARAKAPKNSARVCFVDCRSEQRFCASAAGAVASESLTRGTHNLAGQPAPP